MSEKHNKDSNTAAKNEPRRIPSRLSLNKGVHDNLRVTKIDRATGKVKEVVECKNVIETTGLALFVDLVTGASAAHLDEAGSQLKATGTAGTPVHYTDTACDSGFPTGPTAQALTYQWSDISVDAYGPVTEIEISQTGGPTVVATLTGLGLGSKTASENWIYEWTLDIANVGAASFTNAGLDMILDLITGAEGFHWNGSTGNYIGMDVNNVDSIGNTTYDGVTADAPASQPTSTSWEIDFTEGPSAGTKTWAYINLEHNAATNIWEKDISNEFQGPDDTFTFRWNISLQDDGV